MASLKAIRTQIASVKSTQKITRAMKMVSGARLNKAQQRITELRPYAVKLQSVLGRVTASDATTTPVTAGDDAPAPEGGGSGGQLVIDDRKPLHPLLVARPEKRVVLVVLTSDRGLCGAFNTNINKRAERELEERAAAGQDVKLVVIGRKGRDYFARRNAPVLDYVPGIWEKIGLEAADNVGKTMLAPFLKGEVDALYLVYNEFKSAMQQNVVVERLLPPSREEPGAAGGVDAAPAVEFDFEPSKQALLEVLAPMYVQISLLRALYESMASFLGAQMTAMEAATKNAKKRIDSLTLKYNKARQAAITKELMEIIGGSEALKE